MNRETQKIVGEVFIIQKCIKTEKWYTLRINLLLPCFIVKVNLSLSCWWYTLNDTPSFSKYINSWEVDASIVKPINTETRMLSKIIIGYLLKQHSPIRKRYILLNVLNSSITGNLNSIILSYKVGNQDIMISLLEIENTRRASLSVKTKFV